MTAEPQSGDTHDADEERARRQRLESIADLATPVAVRVAATLGLVDHLSDGLTIDELSASSGLRREPLEALVRHLVSCGILERGPDGGLRPTELGSLLATGHPSGLQSRLDLASALGRSDLALIGLPAALTGDRTGYEAVHGVSFWEDIDQDEQLRESFHSSMQQNRSWIAPQLTQLLDLREFDTVLDIGGGGGEILVGLLRSAAHLSGILVEPESTSSLAGRAIGAAGMEHRIALATQSFFDPLPRGADLLLVSMVLHDWPDDRAQLILDRCGDAGAAGSTILVVEIGPEVHADEVAASSVDLRLMAAGGGRQRSGREIEGMLTRAGCRRTEHVESDQGLLLVTGHLP